MRHCWVVAVVAAVGCTGSAPRGSAARTNPGPHAAPVAGQPVELGQLARTPTPIALAVIAPAGADLAALEAAARAQAKSAKLAVRIERTSARELEITADRAAYMLRSKGLDLAAIERGGALLVSIETSRGLDDVRALSTLIARVAGDAHGWVLDLGVNALLSADAFRDRIPGATPDARKLIAVHSVGGGESAPFVDTMGMARLGLPELYVRAVAPAQVDSMIGMINATAQALIVHGDLSRPGELDVDVADLDPATAEAIRKTGGTGKVTWRVRWSTGGDESIHTLVLELEPATGTGAATGTGIEGLDTAIDAFFGKPSELMTDAAADDPELLAAGLRARGELADLRAHFAKGLPPGERLAVKAPFSTADGFVEWMWVDVTRWRKDELTGLLNNDPEYVTTLRAGQEVTVKLADVADYIHVLPDGTEVGGYSVEILRKRGAIPDE